MTHRRSSKIPTTKTVFSQASVRRLLSPYTRSDPCRGSSPTCLPKAPMSEVRLRRHYDSVSAGLRDDMNREALVVADRHALELVEGSQASARDGVELATDTVGGEGRVGG
ncbi:hypothetical protein TIFTF001_002871 [Ficus carica]|uniref:Uncharacterized protein n=1 Tax=Ficus carica TaxID=3494 RepID=A0AA87Z9T1_FICCA|nr:hypothetical protein TIFTF001_002871 [Ficus carica]